jgi:hypothetical protein
MKKIYIYYQQIILGFASRVYPTSFDSYTLQIFYVKRKNAMKYSPSSSQHFVHLCKELSDEQFCQSSGHYNFEFYEKITHQICYRLITNPAGFSSPSVFSLLSDKFFIPEKN